MRRHRSTGTATEEVVRSQGPPSAREGTLDLQAAYLVEAELVRMRRVATGDDSLLQVIQAVTGHRAG